MANSSRLILAKDIKMDKSYVNVLSYTESQMLSLVESNKLYEVTDYSFIRTNKNSISVAVSYETALQSNYIAFQNKDYSNKWFFAWIDEVIFKNPGTTEIRFTVDAWSTWFDYWTKKACWIVREHVNDDTVGANTIQEDLATDELISDYEETLDIIGAESYYWFVVSSNYDPSDSTRYSGVGLYGKYPQGSMWFAWLVNILSPTSTINEISDWIYNMTVQEHADDITSMFALPYQAFSLTDVNENHRVLNGGGRSIESEQTYAKESFRAYRDYTVKNNKCLVYPYSFMRVSNNVGNYNDYKIEQFSDNTNITLKALGVPCVGYSGKLVPTNYKGQAENQDEGIMLGKYPTLSWSSDGFTNWITQNAVNIGTSIVGTIASGVTGNVAGVAGGVASLIGNFNTAMLQNNNAQGNVNAGDVSFSNNLLRFKVLHMRLKTEVIKIIDDYFSRFGYKINRIKQPNITGRTNWNYVEIGSSSEIGYGEVPSIYMEQINNACRQGVTIWHNHSNLGNFSLDNSIV